MANNTKENHNMTKLTFKLTTESKVNIFGITLFRIEATVDIPSRGVKKGDKGGWVESERLSNGNARVYGDAWVSGNAQVYGNAWVSGDAWVSGNAQVSGDTWVSGNAQVYGNARVSGNAQVYGNAQVSGDAWVYGDARVSGDTWVSGNARVYGDAQVYGNAQVSGNARLTAKAGFKAGWFIGGDDTKKITEITDKTGTDYWQAQYVLGDYEIEGLDDNNNETKPATITIGGTDYEVTAELTKALANLKEVQ